jgi:hypothetical protein
MFARALIAFLALPGVVAGLAPALLVASDARRSGGGVCGFMALGLGLFCLLWCRRDFLVSEASQTRLRAFFNDPRLLSSQS